ncbi:MAG: GTPase domain-containing protein [Pseudomonadota bacterium]
MSFLNEKTKEINYKVLYYGPALAGKTTTLRQIYQKINQKSKGQIISVADTNNNTLYFDFIPLTLGKVKQYQVHLHLYSVPDDLAYKSAQKLIAKGIDGVVFVADSQLEKMEANLESMKKLQEILIHEGVDLGQIPMVIQYNKRDLPEAVPLAEMQKLLNPNQNAEFETIATSGTGILETLQEISKKVLKS